MCDKAILENDGTLESVPNYYKNQEMYHKAVDNYLHVLQCVPNCYITQKKKKKKKKKNVIRLSILILL